MKCESIFIQEQVPTKKFEIVVKFDTSDERYKRITMWIEDFVGDTPEQLADSFQIWADALRELKTKKDLN